MQHSVLLPIPNVQKWIPDFFGQMERVLNLLHYLKKTVNGFRSATQEVKNVTFSQK